MYHNFYGLRESPFALTPDPKYLFLSEAHKEALASMIYGVQERKGFVLILGEVGTGKTTLIRHILGQFGTNIKTVFIFNSVVSFDSLLEMVFRDLELPCLRGGRVRMVDTLNDYLLQEAAAGRYVVLIIDEAQHLSSTVLEEVRMLSNLETVSKKLLQIILVGQPELGEKLGSPNLRQLRQRIGLVAEPKPLTFEETVRYITHRLEVAGHQGQTIFTRRALRGIYQASGGIPRLINVICDKSLVLGYGADARRISRRIVKEAIKDRSVFVKSAASPAPFSLRLVIGKPFKLTATAMLLLLIGIGLLLGKVSEPLSHLSRLQVRETAGTAKAVKDVSVPSPEERGSLDMMTSEGSAVVPERESVPAQIAPAYSSRSPEVFSQPTAPPAIEEVREVIVQARDTLAALVIGAYGRADYTLLDFIKMANPDIKKIDVIKVGERLRFPPFQPSEMVHKGKDSLYMVHLFTMSYPKSPELEKLRATVEKAGRKVYVLPVNLTDGQEFYRVLVGDFTEPQEGEVFYRSFQVSSDMSTRLWR